MGHIIHHAICITSCLKEYMDNLHIFLTQENIPHTDPIFSPINRYKSIFIIPDGSKSGWDASDDGDKNRQKVKDYMKSKRFSDESSPFEWVEVSYSSDDDKAKLVDHEWKKVFDK